MAGLPGASGRRVAGKSLTRPQAGEDGVMENVDSKEEPLKAMTLPVQSILGAELVDIINVLRGINTPEEQVVKAVWDRLRK